MRYAAYFAPQPGEPLHDFGRHWLGSDPDTGEFLTATPLEGFSLDAHAALTATPTRYALHGTLKAPFRLADGYSIDTLSNAAAALAGSLAPVSLGPVALTAMGPFLALCPTDAPSALSKLAERCVRELDDFRAPPSSQELVKRRAVSLSSQEEAYLVQWGYPYVLDAFRFHVTVTSPLDDDQRRDVAEALAPRLAPVLATPLEIRDLCLFGDPADGSPFRVAERFPLAG